MNFDRAADDLACEVVQVLGLCVSVTLWLFIGFSPEVNARNDASRSSAATSGNVSRTWRNSSALS